MGHCPWFSKCMIMEIDDYRMKGNFVNTKSEPIRNILNKDVNEQKLREIYF